MGLSRARYINEESRTPINNNNNSNNNNNNNKHDKESG
jgi:hypothetical protein